MRQGSPRRARRPAPGRGAPGTPAASWPGRRGRRGHPRARSTARVLVALDGPLGRVRRPDEQQHQQRVRVVEPEHQHRHRRQRQHGAREQAGAGGARRTPHCRVEQPHGRHALERLRDEDAPRGEPEDLHRERHRPQGERGLVDGDRPRGVGRAEEQRTSTTPSRPARRRSRTSSPSRTRPGPTGTARRCRQAVRRVPPEISRSAGTGTRPTARAAPACWFPGWSPGPRVAGRGRSMSGEVVMTPTFSSRPGSALPRACGRAVAVSPSRAGSSVPAGAAPPPRRPRLIVSTIFPGGEPAHRTWRTHVRRWKVVEPLGW